MYGYDRQPLQMFIGQIDWNDDVILDDLADQVALEIGRDDGMLSSWQGRVWLGRLPSATLAGLPHIITQYHVTLSMLGQWFLTKEVILQKKAYR